MELIWNNYIIKCRYESNTTCFRLLRAKNVVIENNEFSDGDASVSEEWQLLKLTDWPTDGSVEK